LVFKLFIPATVDLVSGTFSFEAQQVLGKAVVERVIGLLGTRFRVGPGPGGETALLPINILEMQFRSGPGPLVCAGAGGSAALTELTQRLLGQPAIHPPVTVRVLDFDAVNILSLPGGQILVFSGLLNYAENPEEVSGLLAHSLAHSYISQHTLIKSWVMEKGVSGLIRVFADNGFASDDAVIGRLAELALLNRNRQPVEMEADDIALNILEAAGINARPLADLIDRLPSFAQDLASRVEEVVYRLSVVHSHPSSPERSAMIRARAKQLGPAMSLEQWAELQRICA